MCTHKTHKYFCRGINMNITLSADEDLIKKSREYAKKHHTTLNNMIREFLRTITASNDVHYAAEQFKVNALNRSGRSQEGYVFDRDDIHSRE